MVKKLLDWISKGYLGLIIFFLYAPMMVLIVLSFNNSKSRVVWGGFTLKWYKEMFGSTQIMEALTTTIQLAFTSALIATVIGVMAALGIHAMRQRNYNLTMVMTNIPMLNADIVTGIALMLWFVKFMPLSFMTVMMAHVTFNIPYVILSVMPKIKQMNVSIYEAARDLGAGSVYAFIKIILPQLAGGILSGFLMALTMSMDDFVITYFTKGAGVNTLSTMIYGELRKGIKPEMYALSTMIFAVVFVILLATNTMSGMKNKELEKKKARNML